MATGAVVVVVALVVAGRAAFVREAEPAAPPSFYEPPEELPGGPPGTVIRTEPVAEPGQGRRVQRVLYTSTSPTGAPIAVSGVLVAPPGDAPVGGWPVVAWAHGTSGIVPRCAPSLPADGGVSRLPELDRLLAAGNVVVATDYPGLGTPGVHPYLVGESEGRAVLDAVRAARNVLGGGGDAPVAVYGHSQGGHATVFTAQLAPGYAPDLALVGAAAMAPPSALGELLALDVHEPPGIVLTAMAIASWARLYPDRVDESVVVHEAARPAVAGIAEGCLFTSSQTLADTPEVLALMARFLVESPADAPGWSTMLDGNSLAGTPVPVPLLVAQGTADEIVRPPVTTAWVDAQCRAGAAVELHTYAGAGHFQVRTVAAPDVADWLLARLAGGPAPTGCTTQAS